MIEFIQWLTEVGTNDLITKFIANNNIALTAIFGGGGLEFWRRKRVNNDKG